MSTSPRVLISKTGVSFLNNNMKVCMNKKVCMPKITWEILRLHWSMRHLIQKMLRSRLLQCLVIFVLLLRGLESHAEDVVAGMLVIDNCLTVSQMTIRLSGVMSLLETY